jgi:ESS family glutamate:Na+ symporter
MQIESFATFNFASMVLANMSPVANKSGPSPQAFIIVPLVSGFFLDISNSLIIQRFLNWLA